MKCAAQEGEEDCVTVRSDVRVRIGTWACIFIHTIKYKGIIDFLLCIIRFDFEFSNRKSNRTINFCSKKKNNLSGFFLSIFSVNFFSFVWSSLVLNTLKADKPV